MLGSSSIFATYNHSLDFAAKEKKCSTQSKYQNEKTTEEEYKMAKPIIVLELSFR